jgi:hypothetical protein
MKKLIAIVVASMFASGSVFAMSHMKADEKKDEKKSEAKKDDKKAAAKKDEKKEDKK